MSPAERLATIPAITALDRSAGLPSSDLKFMSCFKI